MRVLKTINLPYVIADRLERDIVERSKRGDCRNTSQRVAEILAGYYGMSLDGIAFRKPGIDRLVKQRAGVETRPGESQLAEMLAAVALEKEENRRLIAEGRLTPGIQSCEDEKKEKSE